MATVECISWHMSTSEHQNTLNQFKSQLSRMLCMTASKINTKFIGSWVNIRCFQLGQFSHQKSLKNLITCIVRGKHKTLQWNGNYGDAFTCQTSLFNTKDEMEIKEHRTKKTAHKARADCLTDIELRKFAEKSHGNRTKGIWWPLAEPIDCTAVDQRWKLPKSWPKNFSKRASHIEK